MFGFGKILRSLKHIEEQNEHIVSLLNKQGKVMATTQDALDALKAQVEATTTVEASAALAIHGIADQLAAALAANDTVALQGFAAQLKTSADALSAAIPANTTPSP